MSTCEWCDVPTVAESPWTQDRMEAHRAIHTFGRVIMADCGEPTLDAMDRAVTWIGRRLTSA